MKKQWQKYVFAIMVIAFFCYSILLYSNTNYPPDNYRDKNNYDPKKAIEGELVWQKYNCQSCHQLYGLGGYLGPDLTNIISCKGKDEKYILAMIQSGSKQMPAFSLTDLEKENLVEFLQATNASGIADPRTCIPQCNGMISKDGN